MSGFFNFTNKEQTFYWKSFLFQVKRETIPGGVNDWLPYFGFLFSRTFMYCFIIRK